MIQPINTTLAAIAYELTLVETNKKWEVELSMPSRGICMGPTEKGMILAYKIAIFGPPMTQHESDSVEISV